MDPVLGLSQIGFVAQAGLELETIVEFCLSPPHSWVDSVIQNPTVFVSVLFVGFHLFLCLGGGRRYLVICEMFFLNSK